MSQPGYEPLVVARFMDQGTQADLTDSVAESTGLDLESLPLQLVANGIAAFQTLREHQFRRMMNDPSSRLAGLSTDRNLHILEQLIARDETAAKPLEAIPVTQTIVRPINFRSVMVFYELENQQLVGEQVRLADALNKLNGTPWKRSSLSRRVAVTSMAKNDPSVPKVTRAFKAAQPASLTLLGAQAMTTADLRIEYA